MVPQLVVDEKTAKKKEKENQQEKLQTETPGAAGSESNLGIVDDGSNASPSFDSTTLVDQSLPGPKRIFPAFRLKRHGIQPTSFTLLPLARLERVVLHRAILETTNHAFFLYLSDNCPSLLREPDVVHIVSCKEFYDCIGGGGEIRGKATISFLPAPTQFGDAGRKELVNQAISGFTAQFKINEQAGQENRASHTHTRSSRGSFVTAATSGNPQYQKDREVYKGTFPRLHDNLPRLLNRTWVVGGKKEVDKVCKDFTGSMCFKYLDFLQALSTVL